MATIPTCESCGEVIGVYEPLVAISDGRHRETSRARERTAGEGGERCFHRACFEQVHGELQASEKRRLAGSGCQ